MLFLYGKRPGSTTTWPLEKGDLLMNTYALIAIAYHLRTEQTAELQLRNNCPTDFYLTVVHEAANEAIIHDIPGNCSASQVFEVDDQETLTILVRREGAVIGCAVLEVSTESAESIGTLLLIRAAANIVIDQNETSAFAQDFPREMLLDSIARSLQVIESIDPSELLEVR